MNFKKISWILITMLIVSSMLLAACQPAAEEPVVEEEPMVEEPMADDGTYYGRAMAGEFAGTVVTMTGPFTDEDAVKFDNSVAAFEEATGIDIQYEGSKEFEASIGIRVEAGDPPDIVDFPQPGLLATFVAQGEVVDVSSYLPESSIDNYNPSWWQMATMAGPDGPIVAGVWHRFNAKSQVWYPKAAFEAAGYAIPTTWDEMLALSDQIVADGDTPWCVGIESGAATGWPATDWMEEVMLRTTSLENYDKWVTGELPFSSPEVKNALTVLTELWSDAYVYGGQEAIVTTFFGDAPTPMFEEPPKCWLHKQGNFITSFFPEGVVAGEDYGFFYLPGLDEAYGSPYLVAGDIMAQFNDRDEVRAVMEFFTKGEALKEWLAAGGALAPQMDTDLNWYGDEIEKGIAALVADATSVRFDGSDLMPGEVGAGSFWKGMTDYFSGTADMDTVMAEIDASWPHEGMMEEAAAEEPMEVVEVTFWHAYATGSAEEMALAKVLEQAAADLPQYQINVLQIPFNDIYNKYRTDVAAGGGPDMFIAPNDSLGDDARAGLIADITDLAAGKLDAYAPLSVEGMSVDGVLYGVPESLKAVAFWYNKELLPEPPATTDELLALIKAALPSRSAMVVTIIGAFTGPSAVRSLMTVGQLLRATVLLIQCPT